MDRSQLQAPILTDKEAETTINGDGSPIRPRNSIGNATRSIFNISLEDVAKDKHENIDDEKYASRLRQELKEWDSLWRNMLHDLKVAKSKQAPINSSILAADKRAYLNGAPNLQMFIRDSVEFRQDAHIFLEKDFAMLREKQENILEISEHLLTVAKENRIKEHLADTDS